MSSLCFLFKLICYYYSAIFWRLIDLGFSMGYSKFKDLEKSFWFSIDF